MSVWGMYESSRPSPVVGTMWAWERGAELPSAAIEEDEEETISLVVDWDTFQSIANSKKMSDRYSLEIAILYRSARHFKVVLTEEYWYG